MKKQYILIIAIAPLLIQGCSNSTSSDAAEPQLPVITTLPIWDLQVHSVVGKGMVVDEGGCHVATRGFVWSLEPMPTLDDNRSIDGVGPGSFTSLIVDLEPDRVYYARTYATNSAGTQYGEELVFRTRHGTVTDIDGNVYLTQTIGDQLWMAENLRVTRYVNGHTINTNLHPQVWQDTKIGAYAIFPHDRIFGLDSDDEVARAYGLLYNWYAVDDPRGICPEGWRVSNNDDWNLLKSLGVLGIGGGLKSTRTNPDPHPRWEDPNLASNRSGWSGLPGGTRRYDGDWRGFGTHGHWHSATERDSFHSFSEILHHSVITIFSNYNFKSNGYSIRCVRDIEDD